MAVPALTSDRPSRTALAIGAAGLALPVVIVGAVYLWAYGTGRFQTPIGFDTPQVIWRANLVSHSGLGSLVGWAPVDLTVHGDRTGVLVFASMLHGLFGIEPYRLMFSLPAIASVLVALAAGSFAVGALEEPLWAFGVYAIGVGASTHMARMAVGSHDNAFVMCMLVAFALTTLLAAAGRRAVAGSIVLLGAAALAHWRFAALFVPVFAMLALVMVPGSVRRWKRGASFASTPSARVGLTLIGGVLAGAASMLMAPESPLRGLDAAIRIDPSKLASKSSSRLTPLRLPVTITAAAAGAVVSWWPRSFLRRWGVVTLGLWASSILVAAVAYETFDLPVPIYRVAAYALAIPMLALAFVVRVGRSLSHRFPRVGAALAAIAIVGALAWSVAAAESLWDEESSLLSAEKVVAMRDVASYLDASGVERPVIFLASTPRLVPTMRQIYAGVPGRLITRTRVFMGTAADLRAGRPTTSVPALEESSRSTLAGALEVMDDDPVIVHVDAFNPRLDPPPDLVEVAPGVRVSGVSGEPVKDTSSMVPEATPWSLAWVAAAGLGLVIVAGTGWAWALVPATWVVRIGVAPAFGAAMLTLFATAADGLGVGFSALGSAGIVLASACCGWIIAILLRRRSAIPPARLEPLER